MLSYRTDGGSGDQAGCHHPAKNVSVRTEVAFVGFSSNESGAAQMPTRLTGVVYLRDKDGDRISCM